MTNEELVMLIQHASDKKLYLEELYIKNKRMIADIANRFCGYADFDDLCQEGFFGLMKAADTWQEEKGVMFGTYAYTVIKSHLYKYIENNGNVVRLPAHIRSSIIKMKKYTDSFYKQLGRKPTLSELSMYMNMSEKQIDNIFSSMFMENMKSTSEAVSEDGELTLEDTIQDPDNQLDRLEEVIQFEQLKSVLWDIVDNLDSEQGRVIREKYQRNTSVNDMADMMGMTPSAIRTLEQKAFRELRKSKNIRKLESFHMSDSHIFSISVNSSGLSSFERTWTSSTERAALIAEKM